MKVSICMITYNHENYIVKAINSVLSQETNFNYELIISNDCSNDKTHSIIVNLINNHPKSKFIKYINHKENIGMMKNFISTLKTCKGKYIALCDGDDYWIDNNKIQMQVDYLDNHFDFNIVYTLNKILLKNKLVDNKIKPINNKVTKVKNVIDGNFIPASSVMFRNIIDKIKFSSWIYESPYGDWPLYIFLTQKGEKIKCLHFQSLVYRKNIGVISNMKQSNISILQSDYNMFSNMLNDKNLVNVHKLIERKLYALEI